MRRGVGWRSRCGPGSAQRTLLNRPRWGRLHSELGDADSEDEAFLPERASQLNRRPAQWNEAKGQIGHRKTNSPTMLTTCAIQLSFKSQSNIDDYQTRTDAC